MHTKRHHLKGWENQLYCVLSLYDRGVRGTELKNTGAVLFVSRLLTVQVPIHSLAENNKGFEQN